AFRAARSPQGLMGALALTVIPNFGGAFASAMSELRREGGTRLGRQSQTWVRLPGAPHGWCVVAAHVSLIDPPPQP
ncbi:MAG: AtzH-like domain-containing protein, partial [Pseudomonadota bacterium]